MYSEFFIFKLSLQIYVVSSLLDPCTIIIGSVDFYDALFV